MFNCGEPDYCTREQVQRRIGLKTNNDHNEQEKLGEMASARIIDRALLTGKRQRERSSSVQATYWRGEPCVASRFSLGRYR